MFDDTEGEKKNCGILGGSAQESVTVYDLYINGISHEMGTY